MAKKFFTQEMLEAARLKHAAIQREMEKSILEAQADRVDELVTTTQRMLESEVPEVRLNPEYAELLESIDFTARGFKWSGLRRVANELYTELREANSSQAFGQLLRAGVQTVANGWYLRYPTTWQGYIQENSSARRQEFYTPLFKSKMPTRTRALERYKETRVDGQDIELVNVKFMGGESFERELFDDDQSGQIAQRMQSLGEGAKQLEDVYVAGRLLGVQTTVADEVVPASIWKGKNSVGTAITTPFSTQMYDATHGNRFGTFLPLSLPAIKQARAALLNALDPLNVKIVVDPRILVHSTQDVDNAAILAHSEYYPATLGRTGENQATNLPSGFAGQVFSKNPLFEASILPILNRYLPDWAWFLGDANKRGLIFQRRDPLEIVQEVPNSGDSFNQDSIRFRSRMRWEVDYIDPRFWFEGNDGSVAGLN